MILVLYVLVLPINMGRDDTVLKPTNACKRLRVKGVFKKKPNLYYKDFILRHFKHCLHQSSPLYWRYTIPHFSSIVGMLSGKHFL